MKENAYFFDPKTLHLASHLKKQVKENHWFAPKAIKHALKNIAKNISKVCELLFRNDLLLSWQLQFFFYSPDTQEYTPHRSYRSNFSIKFMSPDRIYACVITIAR